jgi:hypothetical protein
VPAGAAGMIRDLLAPLVLSCTAAVVCIGALHGASTLYSRFVTIAGQLESERWLASKCSQPDFFANMHQHTDLCIHVENNARVGAFMLALRDVSKEFLEHQIVARLRLPEVSLPLALALCAAVLVGPAWMGPRGAGRRWPQCREVGFKDA